MKLLTQDVAVNANAVTADVTTDVDLAETTVVSGLFFYYSVVAVWVLMVVAVTTVATTAASGSFFYYSSVAVWDAITIIVAVAAIVVVAANFLIKAGNFYSPLLLIIISLFLHIYNTHLLLS